MLEVEPSDGNGRNDNETVASAASEGFAWWLHHTAFAWYAAVELSPAEGVIVWPSSG